MSLATIGWETGGGKQRGVISIDMRRWIGEEIEEGGALWSIVSLVRGMGKPIMASALGGRHLTEPASLPSPGVRWEGNDGSTGAGCGVVTDGSIDDRRVWNAG